jgi:hypothetical protein
MKKKLNLVRETLAPMQPAELDNVNGGAESVSVSASYGRSRYISWSGVSVSISGGQSASASVSRLDNSQVSVSYSK